MAQKKEYRDLILSNTIRIEEVQDNFIKPFNWLAESIREGKAKLNIIDRDQEIPQIQGFKIGPSMS